MKKHLFYPLLWGSLTLSVFQSCRTEDSINPQKQTEDKRFAVFIPKDGKTVNYANGFAYLMKQYDNLHKSNLSGVNNKSIIGTLASTDKTASFFQNGQSYVEFNVRSQIFNGENGDKWIIFPKVQGNNVIGLIYAILTEKETKISYVDFNKQEPSYKEYEILFQEGLDRLRKRTKLNIIASIKPVAVDTDKEWPTEIQVEDVSVPGKPLPNPGGGSPGGGCIAHSNCINPGIDSGGGDGSGGGGGGGGGSDNSNEITFVLPKYYIKDLKAYLSVLDRNKSATLRIFAEEVKIFQKNVGHAFISISQGGKTVTFGFYPNNPDQKGLKSLAAPGIMGDNSGSVYTHTKNYGQISASQLGKIIDSAFLYDKSVYDLTNRNCSNFVSDVQDIINEKLRIPGPQSPQDVIYRMGGEDARSYGTGPNTQ
ncbi:hypothetical protein OZ666_17645 [Elizabethkingia sp. HX QKY]|uniref:hypothetical protein n=1 Tax=Elizabethkingia TaxID=308865 RepID=UPI002A23A219|nr:hypothetical protein [Elizabethkingia sp. HX QKY]MDX8573522.1 hypothetical protein [Elizabethkingia sp. HX QKY]